MTESQVNSKNDVKNEELAAAEHQLMLAKINAAESYEELFDLANQAEVKWLHKIDDDIKDAEFYAKKKTSFSAVKNDLLSQSDDVKKLNTRSIGIKEQLVDEEDEEIRKKLKNERADIEKQIEQIINQQIETLKKLTGRKLETLRMIEKKLINHPQWKNKSAEIETAALIETQAKIDPMAKEIEELKAFFSRYYKGFEIDASDINFLMLVYLRHMTGQRLLDDLEQRAKAFFADFDERLNRANTFIENVEKNKHRLIEHLTIEVDRKKDGAKHYFSNLAEEISREMIKTINDRLNNIEQHLLENVQEKKKTKGSWFKK